MKWFLIEMMAAAAFTVLLTSTAGAAELGGDLLSGNENNLVQLSLVNMSNAISGSSILIDAGSMNGASAASLTTGNITGLTQETSGGINVMMVSTGALSNKQCVISTNTTIAGLPAIQSLIAGATQPN